ncbi:MAG: MazG nucleotide pyrophosphohydrolase domain-containing protein [Coriobacteriia bacterium]|nr:MazG nucleotide pyrophosphohydrolase domain-containing protein [Coriobacteriia bacterium]
MNDCATPARLLADVRPDQPALLEAREVSDRVVAVGFEWDSLDGVWEQLADEVRELQEAYATAGKDAAGRVAADDAHEVLLELGDVLFSVVNVGRKMGLSAEDALHATCAKFRRRWELMEELAAEAGNDVRTMGTERLEELWQEAKRQLRASE